MTINKVYYRFVLLVISVFVLASANFSYAAKKPSSKAASLPQSSTTSSFEVRVAIVDVQSILEHSAAIQSIRQSIEVISKNIQQEISKKETELKVVEEELVKKRSSLTQEAFDKEVAKFNKLVSEAQKNMQKKKSRLEQAHSEAVGRVHKATYSIISELSKKNKFNLVLPSSQVLFAKTELNITVEVIALLNERLQTIKVNY